MSYFGTTQIGKMFLGDVEIAKAYLGDVLVFNADDWGELVRIEITEKSISNRLLSSYDTVDYSYAAISNVNNAYTSAQSRACQMNLTTGEEAESWVYWQWDTSDIPLDADIKSVSAIVRASISNTGSANIASRNVRMYSGTTAKGNAQNITTTNSDKTFSGVTWTRSELSNIRTKIYAKRAAGGPTTGYNMKMYYGKLSVTYDETTYYYTVKVKSNVTGLTVTPDVYEYTAGDTATLTFSGVLSGFTVTDNDVDVTSQLVASGDTLVYTISNIADGHRILCKTT